MFTFAKLLQAIALINLPVALYIGFTDSTSAGIRTEEILFTIGVVFFFTGRFIEKKVK